jgi:hypothetical protein
VKLFYLQQSHYYKYPTCYFHQILGPVIFLEHIYSFICPRFYTDYYGFSPLVMTKKNLNLLFSLLEICLTPTELPTELFCR